MNSLITNVTVAGIFAGPSFQSEMISQSLLWERLDILDQNVNWYKVRQFDNYEGWINKFYTIKNESSNLNFATYIETNQIGVIHSYPDEECNPIISCTFGSRLPVVETKKIKNQWWHQIILPNLNTGWIQDNGFKKGKSIREIIKQIAELFLGTPYVWGGRSSYGFDCSGFVQTIFKFCGINLPRDSKDQFNYGNLKEHSKEENNVGDLIFFLKNDMINHIAISLGNDNYIHSSGYIKINSFNSKNENYDDSLFSMYYCSKSIENLIK
ncbi:MAG: hypothetical protein CMF96_05820 [Candidatus Marinimicrobia bacterium]|nr:hypothetical protein [Candidatus Neomarinimicrobiota bacterium]